MRAAAPPAGAEAYTGTRRGRGDSMSLNARGSALLLWHVRGAFRLLVWLATSVGHTMVALATAFRACGRASADYGPLVIPAQVALLAVWAPTRVLFLALEHGAREVHRADRHLRRRLAAVA